jgi:hypothetical protein
MVATSAWKRLRWEKAAEPIANLTQTEPPFGQLRDAIGLKTPLEQVPKPPTRAPKPICNGFELSESDV